jgi:hypothetical protein
MLTDWGDWKLPIIFPMFAMLAFVIIAGDIVRGHVTMGILRGALVVGFVVQWWRLRMEDPRVTPDTLALAFLAVAWFGMAPERLSALEAWFH